MKESCNVMAHGNLAGIGISGRIASGKTTFATLLASSLNCPRASFGDYVRTVARSRGFEDSRETLQQIGVEMIEDGWERFCRAVLAFGDWKPGQSVVIEGIRHKEAILRLRAIIAPVPTFLVYLTVPDSVRLLRMPVKYASDRENLSRVESHSTEADVRECLSEMADVVLDGTQPGESLVENVRRFLVDRGIEI